MESIRIDGQLPALPANCGLAGVVDVETTGINRYRDEAVELAVVLFAYDRATGHVHGIVDEYTGLRQPSFPIPTAASAVHGITDEMVRGQRLDDERVIALFGRAEFLIAHVATFDRDFVRRAIPDCPVKPWLCSCTGIAWLEKGFANKKLATLIVAHGIADSEDHRALGDARATLALLAMTGADNRTYLAELAGKHGFVQNAIPEASREATRAQRVAREDADLTAIDGGTMTPIEFARMVDVRPQMVYYWLRSSDIPRVYTAEGRPRIPVQAATAWVRSNRSRRATPAARAAKTSAAPVRVQAASVTSAQVSTPPPAPGASDQTASSGSGPKDAVSGLPAIFSAIAGAIRRCLSRHEDAQPSASAHTSSPTATTSMRLTGELVRAIISGRLQQSGGIAQVPLLRGGRSFQIRLVEGGVEADNLGATPFLPWGVFEEAVLLLTAKGGRAPKGNAMNARLGEPGLPLDSVEGHVAATVFGMRLGTSVFRRISAISGILTWAGICASDRGELILAVGERSQEA